jgi:hypothetical protein
MGRMALTEARKVAVRERTSERTCPGMLDTSPLMMSRWSGQSHADKPVCLFVCIRSYVEKISAKLDETLNRVKSSKLRRH